MAKRLFDIVMAAGGLLVFGFLLLLIAALIKVSSPGPVFYCQRRVGRGGKIFLLYKFRTMRPSQGGPEVTAADDSRITRIGGILRRWKLDELPQLWNILRGDMSVIGPRPEVERFVQHYSLEQRRILDQTPGLASLSALVFAHEAELLANCPDPEQAYIEYLLPRKLAVDLDYEARRGFWKDLQLIGEIILAILGKNRRLDYEFRLPVSD